MDQAEEKQEKKQNKKKFFKAALIWYLALAIAAVAATVGWFAMNTEVEIEAKEGNLQMAVDSGDLKISLDAAGEFGSELKMTTELTKYKIDISGDGETLYFPKTLGTDDQPNLAVWDDFVDVTGNNDYYVDLKAYFQTTRSIDVYLTGDSTVRGVEKLKNSTGDDTTFSRRSMYALENSMFSCDAIVGAARVAFLEVVGQDEHGNDILALKNVWVPNDNIQLKYGTNDKATLSTNGTSEATSTNGYTYLKPDQANNCYTLGQYSADDYAHYSNGEDSCHFISVTKFFEEDADNAVSVSTFNNTVLANVKTNMANQAVSLLHFEEDGTLQTKALVIRIWFEGTDREADKACNGGMAKYDLHFIGIQKDETKTLKDGADGETVLGGNEEGIWFDPDAKTLKYCSNSAAVGDGELIYSLDGFNWSDYTTTTVGKKINQGNADTYIYAQLKEKAQTKASNVVKVTIPAKVPDPEPEETT